MTKTTQILILSEDSKSFIFYLAYFLTQFKVNKQKDNTDSSNILEKNKIKSGSHFYIYTKPKNNEQLKITIVSPGANCKTIVDKAKEIKNTKNSCFDRVYCVFDYSFRQGNKGNYEQYKQIISQEKELEKQNIYIINSVPSYEYWLLTHFKECGKSFSSDKKLITELEEIIKCKYEKNKADFFETLFEDKYKKFLEEAILRCKKQQEQNLQNEAPDNNPSSKIYKIIEYIKTFL